eukprot:CAMPEP_0198566596 /NCGR_PEP_ID=MMETSP1462-20131121/103514_1 /TAXON_ID=1333877 /ORGANISM="Brandtodinium nutriculum, Strain RCC3387" /LENGTH=53 /DNA_ID=CAMNT_0044297627 /DNA_START=38 /DNA_END=196 /DNA_ORIENTATION=-
MGIVVVEAESRGLALAVADIRRHFLGAYGVQLREGHGRREALRPPPAVVPAQG